MPVIETVLVYGVIPLAVFLLLALLTLVPGRGKNRTKYRPGQEWTVEPIWWEPHPDATHGAGHGAEDDGHAAPRLGGTAAALAIGQRPHGEALPEGPRRTAAGGARGTW